ncbi:type II restriction enzyme [Eisenbergiella tayi]|uniref:type II restriction enzyme n=1 Tax=Eisenbergiella tayi TaxID=1432052 RepID=UPI00084937E5|nr:type II restriction endonuclease [Eisenbergiella tayi]ODR31856.1 type II restriction endonuclease [Eisenbergiella tayi]
MPQNKENLSANDAWKAIIEKYHILEHIEKDGCFLIKASQIKEFREPRLMAKWDSTDALPEVLRKNKINILPDSRSSYVLGDFLLYQEIPPLDEPVTRMEHVEFPDYESIDINNISSEANAINVLIISGILNDFLGTGENVSTFNGRMGTGCFTFEVDTHRGIKQKICVNNAQCEIDGGFENEASVVIMEAKNVVHEDFHIRQLYYPYRLWKDKVKKPIRLIFSVYSNRIYRLFEYRFKIPEDYSSIELVKSKNYSLQDTKITKEDLWEVRNHTTTRTDDDMNDTDIPFIQANSMDRIISLLENLYENPMTGLQIAELMDFEPRQSDYYFNAGRYLGLFEKHADDKQRIVSLTPLGEKVFRLNYKKRQLKLVELILEHEIFGAFFDSMMLTGQLPDKNKIADEMRRLHVCNESQIVRRAGSVSGWLKWMNNLTNL